ncbi:MAG: hypothetical protein L0338_35270 [Acidobacteria bacterium]|nr:hypothetical protein [Acidobacteriota bacterium]
MKRIPREIVISLVLQSMSELLTGEAFDYDPDSPTWSLSLELKARPSSSDKPHKGSGENLDIVPLFEWVEDTFDKELNAVDSNLRELKAKGETSPSEWRIGNPDGEGWNGWCAAKFMRELGVELPPQVVQELEEKWAQAKCDYRNFLTRCFLAIGSKDRERLMQLPVRRERLAENRFAEDEGDLLREFGQDAISDAVVCYYARILGKRFPRMVKRAEELRVLPAVRKVPEAVNEYLREATRCFVFGQFVASLVLCRTAIEIALTDFLDKHGKGRELQQLRDNRADTLRAVIDLARSCAPRRMLASLDDADEVRRKANVATHEKPLEPEQCKDLFVRTRGILQELYR